MITSFSIMPTDYGITYYIGNQYIGIRPVGTIQSMDQGFRFVPAIMPRKLQGTSISFQTAQECEAYLIGLLRMIGITIEQWIPVILDTIPVFDSCELDAIIGSDR